MTPKKTWTVLENNPTVLNNLSQTLGLSPTLAFHDIYSLTDPDLLALIPRPVHALLVIIPLTPTWKAARLAEDSTYAEAEGEAEQEILWIKQTTPNICGSLGLLHCVYNSPTATAAIVPGSELDRLRRSATPLNPLARCALLTASAAFHGAHEAAALKGETAPPRVAEGERLGQHFVAFVKGPDGRLWELEGTRRGPLERGVLGEDEDALSERAVKLGLGRVIEMERKGGGDLRFSCVALASAGG